LEIAGPRPEIGTFETYQYCSHYRKRVKIKSYSPVHKYSHALVMKRYLIGTSSLDTKEKESCVDAARSIKVVAPIKAGIDCAVAATMLPMSASTAPRMKNQRRLNRMSVVIYQHNIGFYSPKQIT
jgi:hypothetical protein